MFACISIQNKNIYCWILKQDNVHFVYSRTLARAEFEFMDCCQSVENEVNLTLGLYFY